jgi:hypothetical protein
MAQAIQNDAQYTVLGIRYALGRSTGSELAHQLMRTFESGDVPGYSASGFGGDPLMVWSRPTPLLTAPAGGFRFKGADFLAYGAPLAFWPPPLANGGQFATAGWEFKAPGLTKEDAAAFLSDDIPAGIFRLVRPFCALFLFIFLSLGLLTGFSSLRTRVSLRTPSYTAPLTGKVSGRITRTLSGDPRSL